MWNCPDSQEVGLEAATLERVRNSSLVEWFCADNLTGLKPGAEVADLRASASGRGASISERSRRVNVCGPWSSENAGMSSERGVRNSSAGCPRVPGEGYSAQGESGAKARPRGVVDAQPVDIPVPPCPRPCRTAVAKGLSAFGQTNRPTVGRQAMRGRRRVGEPRRWSSWGKRVGGGPGKSGPHTSSETRCRTDTGEVTDPMLPRKASSELARRPYPKPTQVDR